MFSAIPRHTHTKFLIYDSERKQLVRNFDNVDVIHFQSVFSLFMAKCIFWFILMFMPDSLAVNITLTKYKGENYTRLSCTTTVKSNVSNAS